MRISAQKTNFFKLLIKFPVWSTAFCMSASLICLTWKEPILQLRLDKDNLDVMTIGLFFSIDTIGYSITSFVLNKIPEAKKNFNALIVIGCAFGYASMTLTGPAPYLMLPDNLYLMGGGIFLGGCAGAFCNNNCVPALTKTVEGIGKRHQS